MLRTESTAQLDAFQRIIASPAYNILGTIEDFEAQKMSRASFYQASLKILSALNPHRVRNLSLDLKSAFIELERTGTTICRHLSS